jgi:hypothetical protein
MEILNSFFCDAAIQDSNGKVSVLGIFTNITAQLFPATHPHMSLAVMFKAQLSEIGKHDFKIRFIDADGNNIIPPIEGNLEIQDLTPFGSFIFNFQNVKFEKPGLYSMEIIFDKRLQKSIPLTLIKV